MADKADRRIVYTVLFILIGLVIAAFLAVMVSSFVGDDENNSGAGTGETPPSQQPVGDSDNTNPGAQEPTNPNVTGGSSGAGTGTSNDDSNTTPSPAGGVDTNQQQQ